jgi:hypothetical protein
LLLAGCGQSPTQDAVPKNAPRIACAVNGAPMADVCGVEHQATPSGPVLVLRHPDGGFRRVRIVSDGRGVITADGAIPARVKILDPTSIEVEIDGDTYRLPAKLQHAPGT